MSDEMKTEEEDSISSSSISSSTSSSSFVEPDEEKEEEQQEIMSAPPPLMMERSASILRVRPPQRVTLSRLFQIFVAELEDQQDWVDRQVMQNVMSDSMSTYQEELFRRDQSRYVDTNDDHKVDSWKNICLITNLTKCFICLEEFNEEDQILLLRPCGHVFHLLCIQEAVQYQTKCPLCRKDIKTKTQTSADVLSFVNILEVEDNKEESVS